MVETFSDASFSSEKNPISSDSSPSGVSVPPTTSQENRETTQLTWSPFG